LTAIHVEHPSNSTFCDTDTDTYVTEQVIEIFTGGTPFSFQYEPLGGGRAVELVGPGQFTVKAARVRAAVVDA
jgi:hypothetical protein